MKHDIVVMCVHRFVRYEPVCSMGPGVKRAKKTSNSNIEPEVHMSGKEALIYTRKPVLNISTKGVVMH